MFAKSLCLSVLFLCTRVLSIIVATASTASLPAQNDKTLSSDGPISYLSYSATITLSQTEPTATAIDIPAGQPCNNYTDFCSRSYSNITYIGAHNSPFDITNNLFSNQNFDVFTQLNAGIRMLQGQTHIANDTIYYCHTSCSFLNAGTAESYFANISSWLSSNPYEVVTVLIVNGDYVSVTNFTGPLENSGLAKYAYIPPIIPMALSDWPTLGDLITNNKRAVIFMDYEADQTTVPYILDEFSQLWETPFDPTDQTFPCTVQRPPGLSNAAAEGRLYLANHNLNTNLSVAGDIVPVPDLSELNVTNAVSGFGSLGVAANNCASTWGRPPNFLLVDYYDIPNGAVFEVAAQLNGITPGQSQTTSMPSQEISTALSQGISATPSQATASGPEPTVTPQTTSSAPRIDGHCTLLISLIFAASLFTASCII